MIKNEFLKEGRFITCRGGSGNGTGIQVCKFKCEGARVNMDVAS